MPDSSINARWGVPPWDISFRPPQQMLPRDADCAIIGAGFTGLAAAAWLRRLAPEKSVVVLEAGQIGAGASGRTGGMALAESAAGDLPGLGDVLAGVSQIFKELEIDSDLSLPGAWEIGRKGGMPQSPIQWKDSGTLQVIAEVLGGTLDPGKVVSGLARAASERGAAIFENCHVEQVRWLEHPEIEYKRTGDGAGKIGARKILLATNGLSLEISELAGCCHPKLTLAALIAPVSDEQIRDIGLGERKPFYTVDFPYLWGRLRKDNSIIWGAGLVDPESSRGLELIDLTSAEPTRMFASLERRIRGLHRALASVEFTHRWGGPILFREDWQPVFDFHPQSQNGIVVGAYAGHGVALSSYLGTWAAEVLLDRRSLPEWGKI